MVNRMPTIAVKTEFAKNLDVTVSECQEPGINSFEEIVKSEGEVSENPPASDTEYVTPPPSSNFDTKTASVIGIITLISSSPIFLKLLEGGELRDLAVFAGNLVSENLWVLAVLGAIYLLRETIHSALKQWTFGKIIDAKADKDKNSVEIKTE